MKHLRDRPAPALPAPPLPPDALREGMALGVVVVAFGSAADLPLCLDGLLATRGQPLRIVVVDNACPEGSVAALREWAEARGVPLHAGGGAPAGAVTLIRLPENRGFAGGVNAGLARLAAERAVGAFWVLNPDAVPAPQTPRRLAQAAAQRDGWGLLGGRVLYQGGDADGATQSAGGRVDRWRGRCRLLQAGRRDAPPLPRDPDFVSGAHMVLSRALLARTGGLREDYFLYWEEVDLAARRGDLKIALVEDAPVHHGAGTSIGSARPGRGAGAMSAWFNARGALIHARRFRPAARGTTWAWWAARALRAALRGQRGMAEGTARALLGMGPPAEARARLTAETLARIAAPVDPAPARGPIPAEAARP